MRRGQPAAIRVDEEHHRIDPRHWRPHVVAMSAPHARAIEAADARDERASSIPFSVVVATRDRGATVARAIASILATRYPEVELIIVDQSRDAATENAVAPYLARADDGACVRYLRSATTGVSNGRNLGIEAARNEWIAITDDDCEVPTGWLDALAAAVTAQPGAGIVCGNVLPAPHDPRAGFIPSYVRAQPLLATSIRQKHEVEGISACMAVRRSVWRALGGFDPRLGVGAPLRSGAESDLIVRALLARVPVYETPEFALVHHGFRTWHEGREVVARYWFGSGAMYARQLRRGRWQIVGVLARIARRALHGRSRVAASLGERAYAGLRARAFAHGFVAGALLREREPHDVVRAEPADREREQHERR
jgi:GT2 family glycosyltransferase